MDNLIDIVFKYMFIFKIEKSKNGHIVHIGWFWIIFAAITILGLK